MQPITKEELELLLEHDILKVIKGQIPGLITGSKAKHGSGKPRFVEPPIYEKLLKLQKQLNINKNK